MITERMNRFDFFKTVERDVKASANFMTPVCKHWDKLLRNHPMIKTSIIKEWTDHKHKQDYLFAFFANKGIHGSAIIAKVMRGTKLWYYFLNPDLTDTTNIYSSHFFKRYAERTGNLHLMPQTIGKYLCNNGNMVKIYENKNNHDAVYATHEGISLCRYDKQGGYTLFCTFIPKSMLKDTQLQALQAVEEGIAAGDASCRNSKSDDMYDEIQRIWSWNYDLKDCVAVAQEIYSQYFNDMDEPQQ